MLHPLLHTFTMQQYIRQGQTTIYASVANDSTLQSYSKGNHLWDYDFVAPESTPGAFWMGGHLPVRTHMAGYHGILQQWWKKYLDENKAQDVLLVSESNETRDDFMKKLPQWKAMTAAKLELPSGQKSPAHAPDFNVDLCKPRCLPMNRFDLVIGQSALEHLYDPFGAMRNMAESLRGGGLLIHQTHPPAGGYHPIPRDYMRFMTDWWFDIPNHIPGLELLEFCSAANIHVFSCYRKLNKTSGST